MTGAFNEPICITLPEETGTPDAPGLAHILRTIEASEPPVMEEHVTDGVEPRDFLPRVG